MVSKDMSSNSRSESTLEFLLKKYRHCRQSHVQCSPSKFSSHNIYPSRLLDIGLAQRSLVVLRSTGLLPKQDYVCLSHCWGDAKPLALNQTTYCTLAAGVHLEALPKTFQDAIAVARRLEIQYIWIDSLYTARVVDMYA